MRRAPVRLQVWSDYVCPFCYLEVPILDRLQSEYGDRLTIDWKAFELRPEPVSTLDPDGEYLHAVWRRSVYPMAEERGLVLRLPPVQPRSRRAHEAAALAHEHGAFDRMHPALLRAFFEEGRDIGEVDVLTAIAAEVGLDGAALRRALHEGRYTDQVAGDRALAERLGIGGVPAIVALAPGETVESDGVEGVSGAHPDAVIRTLVERAAVRGS
jgi:predicted DsbA family dithiol-disulfide isomerase